MKIMAEVKEIGKRTGVDGLISADRVFGLLERDFLSRDIQEKVAKALSPTTPPNLDAHRTLLRLARTRENLIRIVTTNFDRLFDACRPNLPTYAPPALPEPSRATDFNGVVYLHGQINAESNGARGDGLVLSSSEFGRAYLSDGWATTFVRGILDRYFVVFIGYSADDPPIQYLLEALSKASGPMEGVYAFQAGDSNYANSRWRHKGVTAIPYDDANNHAALWDTLDAWAIRSDDPEAWTSKVVEQARSGPEIMQPHERGQVAHVVSTIDGLRKFSEGDCPPPATWLCVFDSYRRYAKPGKQGSFSEERPFVDPFDLYSLDSDPVPDKIDPEDHYAKREVPNEAWDAFALNKLDRTGLRDDNIVSLRGHRSQQLPPLSSRQSQFGAWIGKVSQQPEAVWWAARQKALHPDIRNQITWQLERGNAKSPAAVRQAWRYLFDFWSEDGDELHRSWYALASEIAKNGWSEIVLRRFGEIGRPYIEVKESFWSGPVPNVKNYFGLRDLVNLDVEYPALPQGVTLPDEWLVRAVVTLRRNLEVALDLEAEIGGYGLSNIVPIAPDADASGDSYERNRGLSDWILYFIAQFKRLVLADSKAARAEVLKWPNEDPTIFARLKIWTLTQSALVGSQQFGAVLEELPDEAFWDSHHSRDLLLALAARWKELDADTRRRIEQRILDGPLQWTNEEDDRFNERKAWTSANRLTWLHDQGCSLQLDLEKTIEELRKATPSWKPEYAKTAVRSLEGRGGWIRTDTEHAALLDEPLGTVLVRAKELSGRQGVEFVQHEPFSGLSQEHPVRAFAVLRLAAKNGEFPEWAWTAFLNAERRKNDRARFTAFIGEQLSRFTPEELSSIIRAAADWVEKSVKVLATEYRDTFSRLMSKATEALSLQAPGSSSAMVRGNREADWTMEAINSPTGSLAEALFDDPQIDGLTEWKRLPAGWSRHLEALLALPDDLRRHVLVILAHRLSWLFYVDPTWTRANILSVLSSDDREDQDALWAGFLWGGNAQGRELFLILKPHMLRMAKTEGWERRGHAETLTGLLLSAWALTEEDTGERWVTNEELRDVLLNSNDEWRSRVVWQAEHWARENREKWTPLLLDLLGNVWPRQIAAKSGLVSARLCDIAFSDQEHFPEMAAIILPLLTKIDQGHLMLPNLRRSKDNIADLYPSETLALLHAVLPENVGAWPYGIDSTLERIGEADHALDRDERLIELKRRWNAR